METHGSCKWITYLSAITSIFPYQAYVLIDSRSSVSAILYVLNEWMVRRSAPDENILFLRLNWILIPAGTRYLKKTFTLIQPDLRLTVAATSNWSITVNGRIQHGTSAITSWLSIAAVSVYQAIFFMNIFEFTNSPPLRNVSLDRVFQFVSANQRRAN